MSPAAFLQKPPRWLQAISRHRRHAQRRRRTSPTTCACEKVTPEQRRGPRPQPLGARLQRRRADPARDAGAVRGGVRRVRLPARGVLSLLRPGRGDAHRRRRPEHGRTAPAARHTGASVAWPDRGLVLTGASGSPSWTPRAAPSCPPGRWGRSGCRARASRRGTGDGGARKRTASDVSGAARHGRGPLPAHRRPGLRRGRRAVRHRPQQGPGHRPRAQPLPPRHRADRGERAIRTSLTGGGARVLGGGRRRGAPGGGAGGSTASACAGSMPFKWLGAIRQAVTEEHEIAVHAVVLVRPCTLPKTSSGKIQRHALPGRVPGGEPGDALGSGVARRGRGSAAAREGRKPAPRTKRLGWLDAGSREQLGVDPGEHRRPRRPSPNSVWTRPRLVGLSGDLETWLGRRLAHARSTSYPTIEAPGPASSGSREARSGAEGAARRVVRGRPDRHHRHGLPLPRGRRPGSLLAACCATASTRSREVPAERREPDGTTADRRAPGSVHARAASSTSVDALRSRVLRHLAARGGADGSRSSGCCWRWPGRRWRTRARRRAAGRQPDRRLRRHLDLRLRPAAALATPRPSGRLRRHRQRR